MTPTLKPPLAGIRIVELARILAGPWCGQLLADLGADVIKVERPGAGDDTRHWGPPFVEGPDGENLSAAYFHSANRGKRSIVADIASAQGQETVRALVQEADVVIENFKVGGLVRHGLDHASLQAINPQLITCSITGFGQNGPYAHRAGYDYVAQGIGGFMSLNGAPEGPPLKAPIAYADILTGLYAATAILAALRRRDIDGVGAHLDVALLDTQVAVLANQALNWMVSGNVPGRMGDAHPNLAPYQTFRTADGEIVVAVGNDSQFARLCSVLGLSLAENPRFRTNPDRVINREALAHALQTAITSWPKQALAAQLEAHGVPAGPINTVAEAFDDPQVIARGMAIRPEGRHGVGCPIVIDGVRQMSPLAAPALPQDCALACHWTTRSEG